MVVRIALGAAALALAVMAFRNQAPHSALQPELAPTAAPLATFPRRSRPPDREIVVYVVGEVARPGLYRLNRETRIDDAVRAAGGLRPGADPAAVNLAQPLRDGDEVFVPASGTAKPRTSMVHRRRHRTGRSSVAPAAAVDVNAAGADELAAVPGIGRTIASRIVDLREQQGAFDSLDELLDVAGMTQARLERATPYLRPLP